MFPGAIAYRTLLDHTGLDNPGSARFPKTPPPVLVREDRPFCPWCQGILTWVLNEQRAPDTQDDWYCASVGFGGASVQKFDCFGSSISCLEGGGTEAAWRCEPCDFDLCEPCWHSRCADDRFLWGLTGCPLGLSACACAPRRYVSLVSR